MESLAKESTDANKKAAKPCLSKLHGNATSFCSARREPVASLAGLMD